MAAGINKAVVPRDYARLLCSVSGTSKFQKLTALTATHDLTSTSSNENNRIDVSSLPSYDMVGEIECIYPKGSMSSISPITNNIYTAISRFKLDPEILSKYRLIRLIVQPNFYLFVSTNKLTLYYKVQLTFDGGSTYYTITDNSGRGLQIAGNWGPQALVEYTTKLAFMFDTKTKEFYRDTKSTALWNSDEIEPITEEEYSNTKVTPHKAVVPNDYTVSLVNTTYDEVFNLNSMAKIPLSTTNIKPCCSYPCVGEIRLEWPESTQLLYGTYLQFNFSFNTDTETEILKNYRFVRFILSPNITISFRIKTYWRFGISCFGVNLYYSSSNLSMSSMPIPSGETVTTETMSIIFDTRTKKWIPESNIFEIYNSEGDEGEFWSGETAELPGEGV